MTVHIDNAGRLVVPKAMRERLGFVKNAEIEAVETSEGILLRPMRHEPALVKVEGLWVHRGKSTGSGKPENTIQDIREDRIRSTTALDK